MQSSDLWKCVSDLLFLPSSHLVSDKKWVYKIRAQIIGAFDLRSWLIILCQRKAEHFWQPCTVEGDFLSFFSQNVSLLLRWTAGTSNNLGFRGKTDQIIWCHLRPTSAEDHNTASWHAGDYSWHSRLLSWRDWTMDFCCGKWTVGTSNLCQNNCPIHFSLSSETTEAWRDADISVSLGCNLA